MDNFKAISRENGIVSTRRGFNAHARLVPRLVLRNFNIGDIGEEV